MRKRSRTSHMSRSSLVTILFAFVLRASVDQDRLTAGQQAFNEGKYADAITLLHNAATKANACDVYFLTGLARYRIQQFTEALVDLQSAVGCNPKNVRFRLALAEVYMQKGDDTKALLALQQSLELEPRNRTALADEASLYLRHEMNAEAVASLKNLIAVDPQNPRAYSDIGAAYAGLLDFRNAKLNFAQAMRLKPDDASALIGLGHAELKSDHPALSAELFTRAIKAAPKAYEPHYLRGLAFSGMGRNADAYVDLQMAIKLGGKDPEIYYHLAQIDRALGYVEDAREALSKFSSLRLQSSQSDEAKRQAARLTTEAKQMIEQGQLTAAIDLLQKVLALEGETPRSLFRLASLYFDTQQYVLAKRDDQKAIDLDPSEWTYWYLLGLIDRNEGRAIDAEDALQTALSLNPASAEVVNQLGELFQAQGNYPEAIRRFEKAIELSPREPGYQQNLQSAQRQSSRP